MFAVSHKVRRLSVKSWALKNYGVHTIGNNVYAGGGPCGTLAKPFFRRYSLGAVSK